MKTKLNNLLKKLNTIPVKLAIIVFFTMLLVNTLLDSNILHSTKNLIIRFISQYNIFVLSPQTALIPRETYLYNPFTLESLIKTVTISTITYLFAQAYFKPIQNIARLTNQVTPQTLDIRIPTQYDLTEYNQLAQAINKTLDQLQIAFQQQKLAYQAQSRFVSDAAHQLKTPIAIIQSNLESLEATATPLTVAQSAFIQDQKTALAKLNQLINNLLLLANTGQLQKQEVYPALIIEEIKTNLTPLAQKNNIQIILQGDAEITLKADPALLEIAFTNLIENAILYNRPNGTVTITLATQKKHALITIQDTGIGIPPQEQPLIFNRFHRSQAAHTQNPQGTGLGLCLVENILSRHNATIELNSQPQKGSKFILKIPQN